MTRSMGDAIGAAATALVAENPDVFAVYVTGKGDVPWGPAELTLIPPGKPVVHIDQGATGSPVPDAHVRDVEQGAWTIDAAVNRTGWTTPRPTIYLSKSSLPALAGAGWQGDIWVADYDGIPAINFTVPPGMTCIGKQYTDTAQGGAVDLSVLFDANWPHLASDPLEAEVLATATYPDGRMIVALTGTDGNVYVTEQPSPSARFSGIGPAVGGGPPVAPASLDLVIVGGVPSLFAQGDPAKGNGDVFTSWKNPDGSWAAWAKIS